MSNWAFVLFVFASGFIGAGLLSAIHTTAVGTRAQFRLSFDNPVSTSWSVFLCMFAGPYIIASNSMTFWRLGFIPSSVFSFCLLLATLWSFCCGIIIAETLRSTGLIVL